MRKGKVAKRQVRESKRAKTGCVRRSSCERGRLSRSAEKRAGRAGAARHEGHAPPRKSCCCPNFKSPRKKTSRTSSARARPYHGRPPVRPAARAPGRCTPTDSTHVIPRQPVAPLDLEQQLASLLAPAKRRHVGGRLFPLQFEPSPRFCTANQISPPIKSTYQIHDSQGYFEVPPLPPAQARAPWRKVREAIFPTANDAHSPHPNTFRSDRFGGGRPAAPTTAEAPANEKTVATPKVCGAPPIRRRREPRASFEDSRGIR